MDTIINIASQFSTTPGARHKEDGPFSGQEFRERFLEPLFHDTNDNSAITVIFDGLAGYPTSFLEEAFGGLARKYGIERCLKRFRFVTHTDKLLVEELNLYIKKCHEKK